MRVASLVTCLIAAIPACATTPSGGLTTNGMSALIVASTPGDGSTTVATELFSGAPEQLIFVELSAQDALTATAEGAALPLVKDQALTIISYQATFPTADADEQFVVSFARSGQVGAPASTATLPDPFALDPLPASQSRATGLTITWSPSGTADLMQWEAQGDCITSTTGSITGDTGTYTIQAATIAAAQGQGSASCTMTLELARIRRGMLDPHFGSGGAITAQQARSATLTSTP